RTTSSLRPGRSAPRGASRRLELHPEHPRPVLAGDQELVGAGHRGDAVEHVRLRLLLLGQQPGRVSHRRDLPRSRIDPHDVGAAPHIAPHLAAHALQLVELLHRATAQPHRHPPRRLERAGIPERQLVAAVAHHQPAAVEAQPPALPGIPNATKLTQSVTIPLDRNPFLPGELPYTVTSDGDPLPEEVIREPNLAAHLAGGQVDGANNRLTAPPGAFVEEPISDFQALSE